MGLNMTENTQPVASAARVPALFTAAMSLLIITSISGFAYAMYIRPLYQKYLQLSHALNEQSVVIGGLEIKSKDPALFERTLEALRSEIDSVENELPSIEMASAIMNGSVNQAKSLGLHFQSMRQDSKIVEIDYTILPVHVTLMGTYVDLLNWLYWMSQTQKLIKIEKIDFSVFSEDASQIVLVAELDFQVYARSSW